MDVTQEAFRFCEIRRHLWNESFSSQVNSITDARVDIFLDIQKLLFKAFVLEACNKGGHDLQAFGSKPFEFLQVEISQDIDQLRIFAASSRHPTQWRDQIVTRDEWTQRTLLFIDFFDWYPQDPKGRCSYPLMEVEARMNPKEAAGERWLVPNEYIIVRYV